MKRDRRAEEERLLVNAEAALKLRLREVLVKVVVSGFPLFTNSHFNADGILISIEAQALFESSLACLKSREALSLPVAGSVGRLFVEACEEAASTNEHRRGPRKLAAGLLDALA